MGPEIVWLPTFFKLSSFVFHRRKKSIQVWNDYTVIFWVDSSFNLIHYMHFISYFLVKYNFESLIKDCLCDFSLSSTTSALIMLLDVGPGPVGRTTYSWDIKTSISTLVHASALIRSLIKT